MAAQAVCKAVNGVIFDSREYQTGVTLLKKDGLLSDTTVFDGTLFQRSATFHRLLEFSEKEGYLRKASGTSTASPSRLRIWLPYALLERLALHDQQLVPALRVELANKSRKELREEVEDYLYVNRRTLGGFETLKPLKECLGTVLSAAPVVGPVVSLATMFYSLKAVHDLSQIRVSNAAQLIGIALATEKRVANLDLRYRVTHAWIAWLQRIFVRRPSEEDRRWVISQREMGAWTETGMYVPWFEHSEEHLQRLGLV